MKRLLFGLATVVVVAGVGAAGYQLGYAPFLGALAQSQPAKSGTAPAMPAATVEAARVTLQTAVRKIAAVGSLVSNESVIVRPEIAGRIVRINFTEGGRVEKGRVLFELDSSTYRAQIEQARANRELSEKNYQRADELLHKGAGTPRSRDEATASLKVNEATLAYASTMLEKTILRAPFDGLVGLRKVSVGDYVSPGQDMVNLESIDPIKIDFQVPEFALFAVAEGQRIEVRVDAFPQATFEGTVAAIDPRLDATSRSIIVRARIPNPDARLRPGLFARVNLETEKRQGAVMVPEQAIVPIAGERFVYRVVDGKALQTKVALGIRQNGLVEVMEGLTADAVVITAGHQKVRHGAPVNVLPGT